MLARLRAAADVGEAAWHLARAVVMVRTKTFAKARPGLLAADAAPPPGPEQLRVHRAVRRAGRLVPGTTCLSEGVAAKRILLARGYGADLHVGVRQGEGGKTEAHAWLACGTAVVTGGPPEKIARYTVIDVIR